MAKEGYPTERLPYTTEAIAKGYIEEAKRFFENNPGFFTVARYYDFRYFSKNCRSKSINPDSKKEFISDFSSRENLSWWL